MPFELHVTPGDRVFRVRGSGRESFDSTMESLRRISADPRLPAGAPVLMDVRELDYLATPPEVTSFASSASMPSLWTGRRVAVLTRRGTQLGIARAFAAKAAQAQVDIRIEVFVEPELAERWLRESG